MQSSHDCFSRFLFLKERYNRPWMGGEDKNLDLINSIRRFTKLRIFTNEEKLKAIELFIQYDFSPGAVITQIGYPAHRSVLYRWYKAYKANGDCFDNV